eukprot:gene13796-3827_t
MSMLAAITALRRGSSQENSNRKGTGAPPGTAAAGPAHLVDDDSDDDDFAALLGDDNNQHQPPRQAAPLHTTPHQRRTSFNTPAATTYNNSDASSGASSGAAAAAAASPQAPRSAAAATPRRFPGPAGMLPPLARGQSLKGKGRGKQVIEKWKQLEKKCDRATAQGRRPGAEAANFSDGAWMAMLEAIKHFALGEADASITLADPSGEIKGTVHRKVLDKYGIAQLTPGAVLSLQNVSVFSPTPRSHYLNLTERNVSHLFTEDATATRDPPHPSELAPPPRAAPPVAAVPQQQQMRYQPPARQQQQQQRQQAQQWHGAAARPPAPPAAAAAEEEEDENLDDLLAGLDDEFFAES